MAFDLYAARADHVMADELERVLCTSLHVGKCVMGWHGSQALCTQAGELCAWRS